MSWSDRTRTEWSAIRNGRTEQRVFKWGEVKKLKRRELYHLFVEAGLAGWDGVERQKKAHAHERATNSRLGICWDCEHIFKKLKPLQEDEE